MYSYAQKDTLSVIANELFCALAFLHSLDVEFYYKWRIVPLPVRHGSVPPFSDVHLISEEMI